ncbi:hypothetical protein HO173_010240 [Letharia columbiana]|uniref:Micro-fibrillar-associated protein 1 C-terminal domain-containing protein n=1 Tax=Letharia columbiana TaxID=112416 RepID=A0A8H6FMX4_9LECA|nr:uncharacterized protein HO173_010240 [Letharia columbiana]KAF6231488.1 hypothetical protein HO173_010240 [Letharia columbiana]
MSSKKMTANPVRPARYRPGKAVAEEPSSDEEDASAGEEEQSTPATRAPAPTASSFPSDATRIAGSLKNVNLNERRRQAAAQEAARVEAEKAARVAEEEGFVTEESEEQESSDEESGPGSGSDESSSEEEAPKVLLRPTFIKKDKRKDSVVVPDTKTEEDTWAEEQARRKEKADVMIQEQLEKDAAARAAGKKDWDDDEIEEVQQVDDTDDLDPEIERAAWKLRELKRVKREREAIEIAEKEREEIERRRNLSKEERDAEDKDFIEKQKEEQEGKGKMGFMQKYYHKGAFFQDDAKAEGLDRRDIMGSRYQDDSNRELLPQAKILGDGEPPREEVLEKPMVHLTSVLCQIKELEGKVALEQILSKLESEDGRRRAHQKVRVDAIEADALTRAGEGEAHQDGPTHAHSHHPGGGIILTRGHRYRGEIEIEVGDDPTHTLGHLHRGEIDTATSQADESGALLQIRTAMEATSGEE